MKKETTNTNLLNDFLDVNKRYEDVASKEHLWLKQLAKAYSLTHEDHDLQLLYQAIQETKKQQQY